MYDDLQRRPKEKDILCDIDDWIAEVRSLSPDHSLGVQISTSWESLSLIYILAHVWDLYWMTDEIIRKIAHKAYQMNYEGSWAIVQEILEQQFQNPQEFYEVFLRFYSPEDFFGNLKRTAKRTIWKIRFQKRDPHGPIRRTQRVRGYRDHGTLRPIHQYHGIPPSSDVEKEDRRHLVAHPLLKEEKENSG